MNSGPLNHPINNLLDQKVQEIPLLKVSYNLILNIQKAPHGIAGLKLLKLTWQWKAII
jgi:hypothetical protein